MGGRERSWARAALSRLPRWLTALGIVLVLGELAAAVLLAAGPSRAVPGTHGTMQTVVLRVDGVGVMNAQCAPRSTCGPDVAYTTPTSTRTYRGVKLPFTRTVEVPAGGAVMLRGSSEVDTPVTCSITAGTQVLSRTTTYGSRNGGGRSIASCHGTTPSGATSSSAPARTVGLRVDSGQTNCPTCGPQVEYRTPTGGAVHWSTAIPFTETAEVQAGGIVTLDAIADTSTAAQDWAICTISVNGTVLSRATTRKYLGQAVCQTAIP